MWLRRLRARPTELAFVVGLLLLAGGLRLYQFDRVPSPNETSDEYAYLWAGWTLLHEGTPTAWSEKGAYGAAPTYLWHQARYRLVSPWFDHPPLYALLVGAAASLRGGGELFDASLPAARLTAVAFATASTGLLYAWARAPYGRPAASLGALLFATIPTVVVAGRLALAESLIVPLQLLALIAAERYRGAPASPAARRAPWLALVLAAVVASVLAKVPGVAVGGSVGLFLAWRRLWGAALASLAAVLLGIAVFVAYGCALDCGLFRLVLADQGARARGFEALSRVLAGAMAEPLSWRDAWLPFLWLALAYAALRRDRLLAIAVLPYLVFTVAAVDQNEPRVWYRYPLFPYLCLAGGLFIRDAFRRPASLGLALLVFGVGFGKVGEAFPAWELLARVPRGQQLFPALVATCGALLAAPYVSRARWAVAAATSVGAAGLAAAIAASFWTVLHAESLHPPFRPASSFDIAAPTRVGFVLQRYDAHPTTLPPGGTLRLTVTGLLLEDASAVPTRAYLQPVDRRSKQRGAPRVLGAEAPLAGKSGEEVTLDLGGALPEEVGEGDYDVGVVVADEPIGLGLVRVRRSGGAEDEPLRPVGRPTVLGDRLVLERAGFGPAQTTADGRRHPVVLRLAPLRPTTAEYH
ncbi:MAG TPA: glycosyltransferase family 39 protein, partial [Chloroflexota bacterium]